MTRGFSFTLKKSTNQRQWDAARAMLAGAYALEIRKLAEQYRERIVAGEFSGEKSEDGTPAWLKLANELREHPWASSARAADLVLAVSPWMQGARRRRDAEPWEQAEECLARDVLTFAIVQGWLQKARGPRGRRDVEPAPARA